MPYRPPIGGVLPQGFDPQFPLAQIDHSSVSTALIELLANDDSGEVLGHASGFFWRSSVGVFLVTARHVLSGRDPFTDELTDRHGFVPQHARVSPMVRQLDGNVSRLGLTLNLLNSEGHPLWQEDPEFPEFRTDIAALRVEHPWIDQFYCLNEGLSSEQIFSAVGFECSVLGYPTPHVSGMQAPVWRRGSIASEPGLAVDGKPMFLLDATTSPGFSGGPVLRRHIGPVPIMDASGATEVRIDRVLTTTFVGVYAGRLQNRHIGGEVPFVFFGNRVPLVIGNAP